MMPWSIQIVDLLLLTVKIKSLPSGRWNTRPPYIHSASGLSKCSTVSSRTIANTHYDDTHHPATIPNVASCLL